MVLRAVTATAFVAATLGGAAAAQISHVQERELGKRFDMMAAERLPIERDPEFVSYVDEIGQDIVKRLDSSFFDYRFAVVRDPSINAFAVPGGYIYVNVGLLNHARNDDEVAAVLGHEVAHVHAHHMARQQEKSQLISYASLLAMLGAFVQPGLAAAAAAAGQAAQLKYRREFEQEADYLGVRYLEGTRFDPRAMLDFFKKLEDETRVTPAMLPPYLRSHPMTEERLNHLEAILRTKQWGDHDRRPAGARLQRLQALARARFEPPRAVLEQYAKLRAEHADNPGADYLYGVVALEVGRLDEAKEALEVARRGGVAGAERELGRLALRRRRPEVAVRLLRAHLAGAPADGMAWVELARALDAAKDTAGARDAYQRGWRAVPDLDAAHEGYGLLVGRAGEEGAGFYHLGVAARLRGEYERALDQISRALPLLAGDAERLPAAKSVLADLRFYLEIEGADDP
jgi:predicted Zn-dependent protease